MIITISKGQQITIPANIREILGLDVGSKVEVLYEKGKVMIKPIGESMEQLFQETKHLKPKHQFSAEQMEQFNEALFK